MLSSKSPDPRPRKKGSHSSPPVLFQEVDPRLSSKESRPNSQLSQEVHPRLSSKELRPNQAGVKQASCHKSIETDSSKARVTAVPEPVEPTEQLRRQNQGEQQVHQVQANKIPGKEVKASSQRSAKSEEDHFNDRKFLRDAVLSKMDFYLEGNSVKVRFQDPSKELAKSSKAAPSVTFQPVKGTKTNVGKSKGKNH